MATRGQQILPGATTGTSIPGFHSFSSIEFLSIGPLARGAGEAKMITPGPGLMEAQARVLPPSEPRSQKTTGILIQSRA